MDAAWILDRIFLICVLISGCSFLKYSYNGAGMNTTSPSDDSDDALANLYPALVECFAIILCGYVAGRLNVISRQEAKGLNTFVSNFALPCLIFNSLASLELTSVNWHFLLSILLSKSIVFFGVIIIGFIISRPLHFGKPGLYAIFCTQSNDFAIGLPILSALYHKTHPLYPGYLYLMAPISLAILNPIAFVLMEFGKQQDLRRKSSSSQNDVAESSLVINGERSDSITSTAAPINRFRVPEVPETNEESEGCTGGRAKSQLKLLSSVVKSIITNPVLFMTLLGLVGNYFYKYILFTQGILEVFGNAFSATALFLLGLRMVGAAQKLKGDALVLPAVLIAVKILVLPLVMREVTSLINPGANASETLDLSTFGFLYGTFPAAPAAFVFATQYNLQVDLISSAMVACTFVSAPIMFISAKMTSLNNDRPIDVYSELKNVGFNMGIVGTAAGIWLILLFVVARKMAQFPHKITACLIFSQLLICVGAQLLHVVDYSRPYTLYVQFCVLLFGMYSARVWTTLLAIALLMLQTRSLCIVIKSFPYFILIGFGVPITCVMFVGIFGAIDYNRTDFTNPYLIYGTVQTYVTLVILLVSIFVTGGCLIFLQRHNSKQARYLSLIQDVNSRDIESPARLGVNGRNVRHGITDIEDMASSTRPSGCEADTCASAQCSEAARAACSATLREYRNAVSSMPDDVAEAGDPQTLRHVVLLLLLVISMFVCIMLSIWTLVAADTFSGIYVELEFLDIALNVGQICFTFAIFGLDAWSILSPIVSIWRKLWYGADVIKLPDIDDLSFETTHVCHQFIAHHLTTCEHQLSKNIRSQLIVYKNCFKGSEFVEWLVHNKLTKDKIEAVTYASHLLAGRVLRHVENAHYFSDSNLLYTFKA